MKRRTAFIDLRKKIKDEASIADLLVGFDEVVSLTPYSTYILEKLNTKFNNFSSLVSDAHMHSKVIDKYKRIESLENFAKLGRSRYILSELAQYISFDSYLEVVSEHVARGKSCYVSDSKRKGLFSVETSLSAFIDFDSVIDIERDNRFYTLNLLRFTVKRPMESIKKLVKFFLKDNQCTHDNKSFCRKYKSKKINIKKHFSNKNIVNFLLDECGFLIKNQALRKVYEQEFSVDDENIKAGRYRPFIFLHSKQMFHRFELYKQNDIPVIMMQHGSYVNENYFLKYNEATSADINLVFNSFTKSLLESQGANRVYNVGSLLFDKKLKVRAKQHDFLYITYCARYSYSGALNASERSILSTTGENMFIRHREVIEFFGEHCPDLKLCIKVKPGIFLGGQMYVPLKEIAEKYPNVTVDYTSDLFCLIEKSKYIISDYFSSEFSSKNVIESKDIIIFDDILKFVNNEVENDMKAMFMVVSSVSEMAAMVRKIDFYKEKASSSKSKVLVNKYSTDGKDTRKLVNEIIDKYLKC